MTDTRVFSEALSGFSLQFGHGIISIGDETAPMTPDEAVNLASALLQWATAVKTQQILDSVTITVRESAPIQEEAEDA